MGKLKINRMLEKTCKACGIVFKTTRPKQVYCNAECALIFTHRKKAKERTKQNKERLPIVCAECGLEFAPAYIRNVKYCSDICRRAMGMRKGKQYQEQCRRDGTGGRWLKIRFTVFKRDNFACQYCGRTVADGTKLQADHVNPKKNGGLWSVDNLVTACTECNQGKSDVLLTKRQEMNVLKLA